jgi:hypothetical protein
MALIPEASRKGRIPDFSGSVGTMAPIQMAKPGNEAVNLVVIAEGQSPSIMKALFFRFIEIFFFYMSKNSNVS